MKTNIVFEIREPGRPRLALGIYPLRGGFVGLMCIGNECFRFTPSAALLELAGAR